MKILVVHDREAAMASITEVIRKTLGGAPEIATAVDGSTARKALSSTLFDLVILDLTIPSVTGRSQADYRAASDILNELFYVGTFHFPADVIGITQDADALKAISTDVGKHLMTVIQEGADDSWKGQLADRVSYCQKASARRQMSMISQYDYDVLLLTALDNEAQPFHSIFECVNYKDYTGAKEFGFTDRFGNPRRGILFAIGKSGQASAASASQSLITFFRPRLAVMSGFCGGPEDKVKRGDVIFFESSVDWDYGKWYTEETASQDGGEANRVPKFYARPNPVPLEADTTGRSIREYLTGASIHKSSSFISDIFGVSKGERNSVEMELAAAASGSTVVDNPEIVKTIRGLNDAIKAIDMESYGFYHACRNTRVAKPQFFCVKSVADFADGTKDSTYHSLCCKFSASIVADMISRHWTFEG
jgi:nucleoside phosphorylase